MFVGKVEEAIVEESKIEEMMGEVPDEFLGMNYYLFVS